MIGRKWRLVTILLSGVLCLGLLAGCGSKAGALEGRTIVIDPGHGDMDVGTIGVSGSYEKDTNLQIARKLRDALVEKGALVVMTREDDGPLGPAEEQDPALRKEADWLRREEIVEAAGATLLLSIHQNSFDDPAVRGPQMFFLRNSDTGEERGEALAQALQDTVNKELGVEKPRAIGAGNWRLLKKGNQPGCIIECGFFSNPEEEALLQTDAYQEQLVEALVKGLEAYARKHG